MKRLVRLRQAAAMLAIVSLASGCAVRRSLVLPEDMDTLDTEAKYLKIHAANGDLYILHDWTSSETGKTVDGQGTWLDSNRDTLGTGAFSVPMVTVALFETNVSRPSPAIAPLALITGASLAGTIACIANPKACFGSCPTFYVLGAGGEWRLVAEGFSSSVAPSLEASDIDALPPAPSDRGRFSVLMTNEALETHMVRHADLLVVPRSPGSRVYATGGGEFWESSRTVTPERAEGPEGDCLDLVADADGEERTSLSDSTDLAATETMDLVFKEIPEGQLGLVVTGRQSLMSTYLFYQGLSYLGSTAGAFIAEIERGNRVLGERVLATEARLGALEVLVEQPGGDWVPVGETREAGPLAPDTRVVPIGAPTGESLRIRLRFTQGYWRLDRIALASLDRIVEPIRVEPESVHRDGKKDADALAALLDPKQVLTTFPGDRYFFEYSLPPDVRLEMFLESRGYYLEWMRQEWLAEENLPAAAAFLLDTPSALRRLATSYKKAEAEIETYFWSSRYAKP